SITAQIHLQANVPFVRNIQIVNTLLLFKSLHFMYLSIGPSMSQLERAIHADVFALLLGRSQINLSSTFLSFAYIYYNREMFLRIDQRLIGLLRSLLINGKNRAFFHPRSRIPVDSNNRHRIKRLFLLVLNI